MDSATRNYYFANLRLESETRKLWRGNKPIKLTARLFDLLSYLIAHRNHVVSQEELLTNVWAGLSVEGNNVRVTINQLRHLLGDKAAEPKFIATIPKSGYRFIATVTESMSPTAAPLTLRISVGKCKQELQAEQYYYKGQQLIESHEPHAFEKGLSFMREAVRLDPQMTKAWIAIADSYNYLATFHINPPNDVFPLAEEALQKALAIDPQLPMALATLGNIKLMYYWRGKEAAKLLHQSIQLAPHHARAHYHFGMLNLMAGKAGAAIDCMQQSIRLEPLFSPGHVGLAQAYVVAGKLEEAHETLRNLLTLEEEHNFGHYYLSRVYLIEGKLERAVVEAERACELLRHPMTLCLLGFIKARMKKRQDVRSILRRLREMGQRKFLSPYYLAEVYLGMDDYDRAVPYLESAYDMRMPQLFRLKLEPTFRCFHNHVRIAALLRRIKLT